MRRDHKFKKNPTKAIKSYCNNSVYGMTFYCFFFFIRFIFFCVCLSFDFMVTFIVAWCAECAYTAAYTKSQQHCDAQWLWMNLICFRLVAFPFQLCPGRIYVRVYLSIYCVCTVHCSEAVIAFTNTVSHANNYTITGVCLLELICV